MENNKIITSADYFGNGLSRLNSEVFSNLPENVITKAEFQLDYLQKGVPVYSAAQIQQFLLESDKAIQKARTEEGGDADALLKGTLDQITSLKKIHIENGVNPIVFFAGEAANQPNGDIQKGEGEEGEDDLQKANLAKNLTGYYGGDSKVTFTKTGKEIAEKVTSKIAVLDTQISTAEGKLKNLQEKIKIAPNQPLSDYHYCDMPHLKVQKPLSRYPYKMCYYREDENTNNTVYESSPAMGETKMVATSKEMADWCREYNDCVESLASLYCDREALDFWKRNIEEKTKYTLNAKMAFLLGF